MTDEYIRNYVRLEKDPSDPRKVYVYAVTAEVGNNVYDIFLKYKELVAYIRDNVN